MWPGRARPGGWPVMTSRLLRQLLGGGRGAPHRRAPTTDSVLAGGSHLVPFSRTDVVGGEFSAARRRRNLSKVLVLTITVRRRRFGAFYAPQTSESSALRRR